MGRKGSIGKARGGSRPAAVCDRQATPPADPSLPNPPGGGSFRLGLRWFGRNRPQEVCPAPHRLAQPRIPQPQDPSPYSDRLSSRNGSVRSVALTEHSPGSYLGRTMSPTAPRLPCRTARRSVPTTEAVASISRTDGPWDTGPTRGGSGLEPLVKIRASRPAGSGRDGVSPSVPWAQTGISLPRPVHQPIPRQIRNLRLPRNLL